MSDFLNESNLDIFPSIFLKEKHITYIENVSKNTDSFEYLVTQHLRMSGIYWTLAAMSLLGENLSDHFNIEEIVEWVLKCQHDSGG